MSDCESIPERGRHIVIATIGDPRTQDGTREIESCTEKSRLAACRLAGQWSQRGYWISVYLESGECVQEVPLT